MGLDVTVYKNIEESTSDDYNFRAFTVHEDWDWKIKNLKYNAYYKGEKGSSGVGYSYGWHSIFRDALCDLVGIPRSVWRLEEMNPKVPFGEFICFADNEGCLDWEVSEKLYKDFLEYNETAEEKLPAEIYDTYQLWMEIFEEAKDKGVVVYR